MQEKILQGVLNGCEESCHNEEKTSYSGHGNLAAAAVRVEEA